MKRISPLTYWKAVLDSRTKRGTGRKYWLRRATMKPLYFSIVYNETFDMADGPVHVYASRDREIGIIALSLRFGHLWLNLDIVR